MSDTKTLCPSKLDGASVSKVYGEMRQWIATEVRQAKQIDKLCSDGEKNNVIGVDTKQASLAVNEVLPKVNNDGLHQHAQTIPSERGTVKTGPGDKKHPQASYHSSPTAAGANLSLGLPKIIRDVPSRAKGPQKPVDVQRIHIDHGSHGNNVRVVSGLSDAFEVAGQHKAQPSLASALKHRWISPHETTLESDDESSHHTQDVEKWLLYSPEMRQPLIADLHKCDIDPVSGAFMPAVEQPDTYRREGDVNGENCPGKKWRHLNMTSELQIAKQIWLRENLARLLVQQEKGAQPVLQEAAQEQVSDWPSAQCSLRPVQPADFAAIAQVINADSGEASLAVMGEALCVTAEDISEIYERCRDNSMPFIVATPREDEFLDISKWPAGSRKVYDDYVAYKRANPSPTESIVGFAFVSETTPGLGGIRRRLTRFAGKATVLVHPDHRRKLYGSALLDRILLSISPFHLSLLDYKWECAEPNGVYEFPATRNIRQYAKLYIQSFFEHHHTDHYKQVAAFVKKFEFTRTAYIPRCVRTDEYYDSTWLDLVIWECEATPQSKIQDEPPKRWE